MIRLHDDRMTLEIMGEIGGGGADEIPDLSGYGVEDELDVKIDSYGGDFYFGKQLYTALRACPAKKRAVVTTAMSAATMPMAACDVISMGPESIVMIHGVRAVGEMALGKREAEELAQELDVTNAVLARIYSSATKNKTSAAEFRTLMDNESYFDGADLQRLGFPVEETAEMEASRELEDSHRVAFVACAEWSEKMVRKLKAEDEVKEPVEEKEQEVAEEQPVAEEPKYLTEDEVREVVLRMFEEYGVKKTVEEPAVDVDAEVQKAVEAERGRVASLLDYGRLCDVSGYVSSGRTVNDLANDRLKAELKAIGDRKAAIRNAAAEEPLAVRGETVPAKASADALMKKIFG